MRLFRPTRRRNETKYIYINTRLCQACGECIESCPNGVIGKVNLPFHKHAVIKNTERCQGCQQCVEVCQQHAIVGYDFESQESACQ